jgi:hypothetical protein
VGSGSTAQLEDELAAVVLRLPVDFLRPVLFFRPVDFFLPVDFFRPVDFLRALVLAALRPAALRAAALRALVRAALRPAALRAAVLFLRPVVFFAAKSAPPVGSP